MNLDFDKYVYYLYLGILHRAEKDKFSYFRRDQYTVQYYDEKDGKWIEDNDFNLGIEALNPDGDAIEVTSEQELYDLM